MLKKYVLDPSHVIEYQPLDIQLNLTYEEKPICILGRREQVLRNKVIPYVKVLWRNGNLEEITWESEASMRQQYPQLFSKWNQGRI